jgi:hypothetical protein
MPHKTVICLWLDTEAEQAAQHYTSICPDAEILDTVRWGAEDPVLGPGPSGGDVVLLAPADPVVFDRTWSGDGLDCVAFSQLTLDLIGGTGRMPTEGEALLDLHARARGPVALRLRTYRPQQRPGGNGQDHAARGSVVTQRRASSTPQQKEGG